MQTYRSNPPSRQISPRAIMLPSGGTRLDRIERLIRASGVSPSAIGRLIANDSRLIFDLRNGRQPQPKTVRKIDLWIVRREAGNA
ncbi:hypothetical protein [Sphingomonas sp. PB4P5]|uniref:hypothetical protein n=1 Tax=Parasphingomonas puruogangriensis TaxID=3096155 RepID=UPI002FCB38EB